MGSCAIQQARAAGYEVATTASSHNFEYCKRLGAQYVFDYRDDNVIQNVVEGLKGKQSAGIYCPIEADGVVGKCAQLADQLGGHKFVSIVYPPFLDIPDPFPDGVKIGQCKSHCHSNVLRLVLTWV